MPSGTGYQEKGGPATGILDVFALKNEIIKANIVLYIISFVLQRSVYNTQIARRL